MALPQPGIFSLGTRAHHYVEFDLIEGADPRPLVEVLASLRDARKSTGGVNLVVGFAAGVWRSVAPDACPSTAADFEALVGPDGFTMPETQHDAWIWVSGSGRDEVLDMARLVSVLLASEGVARVADEITGFAYRDSRDLTGFVDGTENPPLDEAPPVVVVAEGEPGAGASVVLVQRWFHDLDAFDALPIVEQEQVFGRTKPDSVELAGEAKPADAHISRVVIEDEAGEELEILRRSTSIGGVVEHGLEFVAFTHDRTVIDRMLRRMVGESDGVRDRLTRFSTPVTGAFYVVPSVEDLRVFARPDTDG